MVFVYIRIYYAAKARARRGIRKPPRRQPHDAVTSFTNVVPLTKKESDDAGAGASVDRNSNTSPRDGDRQIATIEAIPCPMPIPTVTCDLASDISTSDAGEITAETLEQKDTLKVCTIDNDGPKCEPTCDTDDTQVGYGVEREGRGRLVL